LRASWALRWLRRGGPVPGWKRAPSYAKNLRRDFGKATWKRTRLTKTRIIQCHSKHNLACLQKAGTRRFRFRFILFSAILASPPVASIPADRRWPVRAASSGSTGTRPDSARARRQAETRSQCVPGWLRCIDAPGGCDGAAADPRSPAVASGFAVSARQELHHLRRPNRARMELKVKVSECDAHHRGQSLPAIAVLQHRRLAPRRRGAHPVWPLAEPALVYEDNRPLFLVGFLMAGRRLRFHSSMVFSSRSAARPTGRWPLRPSARTGPQRRRVAEGLWACRQHGLQLFELGSIQLGQAACAAGLSQGSLAAIPVLPHPAAHRLTGDFQLASDLSWRNSLAEKVPGFHAAALQSIEVPF